MVARKLRKCIKASPAAEQRGADSCVTDILGACSTPGIIKGLDLEEWMWRDEDG